MGPWASIVSEWPHFSFAQAIAFVAVGAASTVPAALPPELPLGLPQHVVRHQAAVYTLAFGSEGLLASGARDHSIALWNLTKLAGAGDASRRPIRTLAGHIGGVTALAFAGRPKGSSRGPAEVLVSGAADNTTRIWHANEGKEIAVLRHPKTVFGVAVAPGLKGVASSSSSEELGDEQYGELATACWDGIIRIFGLLSGMLTAELVGHGGGLYAVAFSPLDSSLLASASADRTVRIWDAQRHEVLWTLRGHRDHVTTVDWSPLAPFTLASGGWDRRFHLWEIPRSEVEACRSAERNCSMAMKPRSSAKHPQLVWRVAFAPGGEQVAACHGAIGQSPTVVIYDARSGKVVRRLGRHRDTPLVVTWSSDGSWLASAGMDKQVLVYDGRSVLSDLPQGDLDDSEERMKWREDLDDFRTGRVRNITNRSTAGNVTEADSGPQLPHPLGGRVAFY